MTNLRWHGWARTKNGAVTGYVKIRAESATSACQKAVSKAAREMGEGRYGPEEWVCIGVSLHQEDMAELRGVPSF